MSIFSWNWLRPNRDLPAADDGVLSAARMRETLDQERMRADRSGCPFALLVFQFVQCKPAADDVAELARALVRRLRATDAAGYLEDGRIAAVLPATPELGAHILANHVCEAIEADERVLQYEIFLYPHRDHPNDDASTRSRAGDAIPSATPLPADAWLIQPLPFWKRALDACGALVAIVLAAPLLLLAAIAIRLDSPGPVFFSQKRTGLGGRPFFIYKLRTMRVGAEAMQAELRFRSEQDGPAFKMKDDPRVTAVGRFLRRSCIDELPQLWNVLKGDMSLVGPRPLPSDEANRCLGWQSRRLHVTPGLTCIWQVFGGMRVPFQEWMRMDLRYARGRRLGLDLALLCRTVLAVITHRASH